MSKMNTKVVPLFSGKRTGRGALIRIRAAIRRDRIVEAREEMRGVMVINYLKHKFRSQRVALRVVSRVAAALCLTTGVDPQEFSEAMRLRYENMLDEEIGA